MSALVSPGLSVALSPTMGQPPDAAICWYRAIAASIAVTLASLMNGTGMR